MLPSKHSVKIFYSYSHVDEKLRDELNKHMSLLRRTGIISSWYDREIEAGNELNQEIKEHLEAADIILLLVSPDFIHSEYCYGIEMTRAMERHESRSARVIPIVLRPVDWHDAPFGKLLALPKDGKPITIWENQDEAFVDIVKEIRRICETKHNHAVPAPNDGATEKTQSLLGSTAASNGVTTPILGRLEDAEDIVSLKFQADFDLSSSPGRKRIRNVKFTPDGNSLVAGLNQDWIAVWDIKSGQLKYTNVPEQSRRYVDAHANTISWDTRSIAISPDGKFIASTTTLHAVQVWRALGLKAYRFLETLNHPPESVAFSSSGDWLLAGMMNDGTIQSWYRDDDFRSVDSIKGHDNAVEAIKFHPNKLNFISCSVDGTVKEWSIVDEGIKAVKTYEGHDEQHIVDVTYSPDGRLLAAGSVNGQIYMWETSTGKLIHQLDHDQVVREIEFSPDGEFLASGANDHTLKIWRVGNWKRMALKRFDHAVASVTYSPDGTFIALTADGGDKAQLWKVVQPTMTLQRPLAATERIVEENSNRQVHEVHHTRIEQLREQRQRIFKAYSEYHTYLTQYPTSANKDDVLHAKIIRDAIVACHLYPDKGNTDCVRCSKIPANKRGFKTCAQLCKNTLAYIAEMRLTPNCVDQSTPGGQQQAEVRYWGWYGERNINALKDALNRIDELTETVEQQ